MKRFPKKVCSYVITFMLELNRIFFIKHSIQYGFFLKLKYNATYAGLKKNGVTSKVLVLT